MNPNEAKTASEGQAPPPVETDENGVDVTLVRWMLSLEPSERLQFLEERIGDILAVRALNSRT